MTAVTPDIRRFTIDLIVDLTQDQACTVGAVLPSDWTPSSTPHVQVGWDGTDETMRPVVVRPTVRVTVWAAGPSAAEQLASTVQARLLAQPGWTPGVGLMPTQDPNSTAALASFTVIGTLRTQPA